MVPDPTLTADGEGGPVGNFGMIMDILFINAKGPGIQDSWQAEDFTVYLLLLLLWDPES